MDNNLFNKDLIEVKLPKNCSLFLTPEEYSRAVKRGKGIKRTRAAADRNPAGCGKGCRCKGGVISE